MVESVAPGGSKYYPNFYEIIPFSQGLFEQFLELSYQSSKQFKKPLVCGPPKEYR